MSSLIFDMMEEYEDKSKERARLFLGDAFTEEERDEWIEGNWDSFLTEEEGRLFKQQEERMFDPLPIHEVSKLDEDVAIFKDVVTSLEDLVDEDWGANLSKKELFKCRANINTLISRSKID